MSGDVQPRKRKDKKKKKDDLGVEEPRGTAAVLGEGDVFLHSYHEHGTGGHWCAKIIFFSLLAVLVTLIGLIILENRGLTDLEANSVESRYSGVLDGWLEDAPDDDHHDEHTLELLKHHGDDEDDHEHDVSQEDDLDDDHDDDHDDEHDDDHGDEYDQLDNEDEGDNDDEDENDDEDGNDNNDSEDENVNEASNEDEEYQEDENYQDDNSQEQNLEEYNEDDDDNDQHTYDNNESGENYEDENDDLQKVDEDDDSAENDDDDDVNQGDDNDVNQVDDDQGDEADDESVENNDNEDENEFEDEEQEEHEEEEGDDEIEVEKLEKEVSDEEALSEEQPGHDDDDDDDDHDDDDDDDDNKGQEVSTEAPFEDDGDAGDDTEDEEFLEAEIDDPLPVVERIVAPKGKPLAEVEDEPTTAKPPDTLVEEEEYEKQQEELRKEQAQASHVWLKLAVGGALLVATVSVVSRVVAPRDDTPASEDHASREDTPSMIARRMTLIPEESAADASPQEVEEISRPIIQEKVFQKLSSTVKSVPPPTTEESEEEEEEEVIVDSKDVTAGKPTIDFETEGKELYSDDEEIEEDEDVEEVVEEKKEAPVQTSSVSNKMLKPEPEEEEEAEEDMPDDVEIIDDEQLEEELEEEEDEDDISDVDDAELLSRLEAKYGRLPEPERPGQKNKDGGNSIEDWPGEPSEKYWRQQLDEAEQELRQGDWRAASERVSAAQLQGSVRARWLLARAIDASAEAQRDNRLLTRAIAAYLEVLKRNERLSDVRLREVADRTLDRIRFRGNYLSAEPVYRLLIRRFPDVVDYRNNLTVSFLMANRADLAEDVIKETLKKWPNDRIALAHHGFILKTKHNRLEEAVDAFQKALKGDTGPATEPRFYYHLGDSLLLLGRFAEAHEVHKRGAKHGHFLSPAQRSLYNVDRLKSRPWWDVEQTPYLKLARALERSWKEILQEGLAAQALYEKEKEGLKERGEWSQLDLFVRGQEVPGRCKRAPVTCSIVRAEAAAAGCRRGQIKFSAMVAGTHVRPHVGPTNCRLRMHLGLSNTKDTYLRVDQETRQWQVGKVLMFDDSFEHEVWHNGTGTRLVLIVDVWHPQLTPAERRSLPAI